MADNIKRTVFLLVAGFFLFIFSGCMNYKLVKVPEKTEVPLLALGGELKGARIIFVGEVHDEKAHHELQLKVIKALDMAGVKLALGLEMFKATNQKDLDRWIFGPMEEKGFKEIYYKDWRISWGQYSPIFIYAKERSIPMVGLNTSWEIIRQVVKGGVKSLKPIDAEGLEGIKCDVDPAYEKLIREAMGEHSHMRKDVDKDEGGKEDGGAFNNFCEAQVVWDTFMARRIVDFLRENPDRTMVALAGGAHAWKRGIPRIIKKLTNDSPDFSMKIIMPEVIDNMEVETVKQGDTDYLWLDPWLHIMPFSHE